MRRLLVSIIYSGMALGYVCAHAEEPSSAKQNPVAVTDDKPSPDAAAAQDENSFSGSWMSTEGNNRFALSLSQQADGTLIGRHASSLEGSKQIDSVAIDQPPSINGIVKGDSVVVRFKSGAIDTEGGYGHALLTLRGRYLYWQKMDATGGDHLPDNVVLIRQEMVAP